MTMQVREHLAAARELLDAADRRYAAGDRIGASEKLWQAAVHAIQAGASITAGSATAAWRRW